jgi:hypothetical protein
MRARYFQDAGCIVASIGAFFTRRKISSPESGCCGRPVRLMRQKVSQKLWAIRGYLQDLQGSGLDRLQRGNVKSS